MFGREFRLPLGLLFSIPPLEALSLPDHTRNPRKNLRTAFIMDQGHMKDAERHQTERYDQHISGPVYPIVCQELLHRPNAGVGEPAKLHRQWQGPYEVVFVHSTTVYVLRDIQSIASDVLTLQYNNLKPASSSCELYDLIMPPGCNPMVEQIVKTPPQSESASCTYK
ncbi:hypothetical protein EG68_10672 [Paragonimus skrjabini miyazakii]|uniref:Uncharacterized protein n=1 Tax=Paragonimus skrjabini miyazakii TaxID=59628 RepID=A0A8S9YF58_9TREM|nr:hypothetical protein EG68_10672 [Paragonimus skrjabini miyazakii]